MKLEIKNTTAKDRVAAQEHASDGRMNTPSVPEMSTSTRV
jgi:hypothetical protein